MSSKSPIFPMPEPQHFSDYGFDPQMDYFQVLEEARKHKGETWCQRSIDSVDLKLQKPISKEDGSRKKKKKKKRWWWWKSSLLVLRWKWVPSPPRQEEDVHEARARAFSGPVYITETRSGSGPLTYSRASAAAADLDNIPYLSLRDLTMGHHHRVSTSSPIPIYLVT